MKKPERKPHCVAHWWWNKRERESQRHLMCSSSLFQFNCWPSNTSFVKKESISCVCISPIFLVFFFNTRPTLLSLKFNCSQSHFSLILQYICEKYFILVLRSASSRGQRTVRHKVQWLAFILVIQCYYVKFIHCATILHKYCLCVWQWLSIIWWGVMEFKQRSENLWDSQCILLFLPAWYIYKLGFVIYSARRRETAVNLYITNTHLFRAYITVLVAVWWLSCQRKLISVDIVVNVDQVARLSRLLLLLLTCQPREMMIYIYIWTKSWSRL